MTRRYLPPRARAAAAILAALTAAGCSSHTPAPSPATSTTPAPPAWVPVPEQERRQVAASLLMPGVSNFDDAVAKLQAGVGGIFIPSWADPGLLTQPGRDIHALRALIGRDFRVAIDFEGGRVQRFSEILGTFPSPQAMTAGSYPEVEDTAFRIGTSLKAHGIDVDFAPVLDLDGAGLDVVGDRAFSTNAQAAGDFGAAFARGLTRAGVQPVFKHYPGHGRATGDTHLGAVYTPPLPELFGFDLCPYEVALPAAPGAGVMVGHMVVPGLGDGTTPASLNSHAYGLLRHEQGFEGLSYTDDLTGMRAVTDHYSAPDAVVAALAAGADQALWSTPVDVVAVIDAVERAAAEERISPERFAESAARVRADRARPN